MSTAEELEARLTRALERINEGVDAMGEGSNPQEVADANAALEDEKLANAQLQTRLVALSEQLEAAQNDAKAHSDRLAATTANIERLDAELQQVQAANAQLRENNSALRAANEDGVGAPELINAGLSAEVNALRAARSADRAELDAVLAELTPVIEGQA